MPRAETQPIMSSRPTSHLSGCTLYFFLFMAHGCIAPFMPLVWRSKGLSEHEVGLLGAIRPIASFFVTPVLCAFADRRGLQQQILYAVMSLYAIFRPSVLVAGGFLAVGAVEALCSVSMSPIGSLVDSAVRHSFGGEGYGMQRLWGAVGFGVASLISGYLCDAAGGSYEGDMLVFVTVMAVALMASTGVAVGRSDAPQKCKDDGSRRQPATSDGYGVAGEAEPAEMKSEGNHDDASHTVVVVAAASSDGCGTGQVEDTVTSGLRSSDGQELPKPRKSEPYEEDKGSVLTVVCIMLGTPCKASFFAAVGFSGMGAGVIDTFLFIRLEELGGSHLLCGLARLIMCLAEVPFFYLSGALVRRMGVRGVVSLAQLAYLTRFIYYSVLREPWWVLPVEVLHGVTFAAMWAATTDYAHEIAPEHMKATMQGLVTGLHWGLGYGLGAVLGGVLYAGLGASLCFGVSAVLPSLSLLLLALPSARPWFISTVGRCEVWADALRQWTWGIGRAYERVAEGNKNKSTEHRGRNDQQSNGDTHPSGNDHGGKQQTVQAWEQIESAPINSAVASAAFKMEGSKYTGGGIGRSY